MQVIRLQQNSEEWLLHRLGKITGSKAKGIRPMSRNAAKRNGGFWTILAEKIAIPADGENPMERGHRLEKPAIEALSMHLDVPFDDEPGMWISDIDDDIGVSPDGAEPITDTVPLPTYSAEVKALNSASHLKFIVNDILAKQKTDYNPINSVPDEEKYRFRDQCLQYFLVNESLKTHYFVLYDDRIELDHLVLYVIKINREDVEDQIAELQSTELGALIEINNLVVMLTELREES